MMMYSYGDESSHDSQSNRSINSRSNNSSSSSSSSRQSSQPLEMIPSSQVTLLSSTTVTATQTNNVIKTDSKAKPSPLYLVIDSSIFNTSHTINDLIHKEFLHIQDISITKNGMICREASAPYVSSTSSDRHHIYHSEYVVDLVHSDDEAVSFTQSSTINPPPPTSSTIINTSNQSDRYEFFTIDRGDSMIRWTRQSLHHIVHDNDSHGSSRSSSSSSSSGNSSGIITFEPYSMQLVDNNTFIDLVLQSSDGVEFDALLHHFNHSESRSASSSSRWSGVGIHSDDSSRNRNDDNDSVASVVAGNNDKERFMIVLVGIDKSAFNRQKKLSQQSSTAIIQANISISDWIDASITYLMYEAGIQVTRCKTPPELCDYVKAVTRLVSHREMEELITEIDCVHKANKEKPPENLSYAEKENFELRQTWCAMLQMIPLASKDKAQAFVSFNDGMYSCPSKLYHSIYDTSTSASSSGRGLNEGSSSSGGGDVGRQARNNSKRSRKPNSNTNNNQGNVSINYGTSVVSTSIATTTMMTMINNSTACTQASAVSQGTARPLLSRHEDANAFQNCFGSNKQGVVKNQSKLSRHVFNLFTATDPNALINNI